MAAGAITQIVATSLLLYAFAYKNFAVGVAFSAQHVARVPRDDYDQPLDWIVTEKAAHHFASVPAEVIAAMHQVW
ncbi:MAG: hypothetical protein HC869_20785 [Rhodospirillales bacterium]|nr:hypothetical protein [Rhodospirillales bacterium]